MNAQQEKEEIKESLQKIQKLTADLQEAQDAARENVEAAVVLSALEEKGVVSIDQAFNVTLSQTGEQLNQH